MKRTLLDSQFARTSNPVVSVHGHLLFRLPIALDLGQRRYDTVTRWSINQHIPEQLVALYDLLFLIIGGLQSMEIR